MKTFLRSYWPTLTLAPLFLGFLVTNPLHAKPLGQLQLTETLLTPKLSYTKETNDNDLSLSPYYLALQWNVNPVSMNFKVGDRRLLLQSKIFQTKESRKAEEEQSLGVIEAYGEVRTLYGQFNLGLIPISFSQGGSVKDYEVIFDRSLYSQWGVTPLRDYGLSWSNTYNGYFTTLTARFGESTPQNKDQQLFANGYWGWRHSDAFTLSFGAQFGHTKNQSPIAEENPFTLTGFLPQSKSTWAVSAASLYSHTPTFSVLLDLYLGHYAQQERKTKFQAGSLDVEAKLFYRLSLVSRIEAFDPNTHTPKDDLVLGNLGLSFKNLYNHSRIVLYWSRYFHGGLFKKDDRIHLKWILSSQSKQESEY